MPNKKIRKVDGSTGKPISDSAPSFRSANAGKPVVPIDAATGKAIIIPLLQRTRRKVLDCIKRNGGITIAIAREMGVRPSTVRTWITRYPWYEAAVRESREQILDRAEEKLFEAVDRGEEWALKFTLSTAGKNRGYTNKLEVGPAADFQVIIDYTDDDKSTSQTSKSLTAKTLPPTEGDYRLEDEK